MSQKFSETSRFQTITILNEGVLVDTLMVLEFIRRLTTPFNRTAAFKLGIIDAEGNLLKKPEEFTTRPEREAYSLFNRLVFNLKRLLEKLPLGKTRIASFAAALFLIKEQNNQLVEDEDHMYEMFRDYIDEITEDPKRYSELQSIMKSLGEEVTNGASAAIAGVGDGTVVVKKKPAIITRNSAEKTESFRDFIKSIKS